jgi:3-phenylpropionate/cinnamic acid dioxygenase small subunit
MLTSERRSELEAEVQRFLYEEAWLLDERRFDEWLDLFTEDCAYGVAVRETIQREGSAGPAPVSTTLFTDDKAFMAARVRRFETHLAHAEQPPSLTRHLISNILVDRGDGQEELRVRSSFIVLQARGDDTPHLFSGKREDALRPTGGQWKIARRAVLLDTSLLPRTITVFF